MLGASPCCVFEKVYRAADVQERRARSGIRIALHAGSHESALHQVFTSIQEFARSLHEIPAFALPLQDRIRRQAHLSTGEPSDVRGLVQSTNACHF